jgi:hypothetical protein
VPAARVNVVSRAIGVLGSPEFPHDDRYGGGTAPGKVEFSILIIMLMDHRIVYYSSMF